MKRVDIDPFINEVISMAWADDIPFEAIRNQKGLTESEVIQIMRGHLKSGSFKLWRARVSGRLLKHQKKSRLLAGKRLS